MLYPLWRIFVLPAYQLWVRKVTGVENLPKDNPFIIALNHTSYYDTVLPYCVILPVLDKKIHPLVNSHYWKNPITRNIMHQCEAFPVFIKDKDAKRKNKESIGKLINCIKKGELAMIFPEGTRSFDGKLKKAKTGIARIALKAKVPVVPIGIKDSHKVLTKGKMLPTFNRCEFHIGKPMHFEKYYKKKIDDKLLEKITRDIMKEIGKLIGQKYNY